MIPLQPKRMWVTITRGGRRPTPDAVRVWNWGVWDRNDWGINSLRIGEKGAVKRHRTYDALTRHLGEVAMQGRTLWMSVEWR